MFQRIAPLIAISAGLLAGGRAAAQTAGRPPKALVITATNLAADDERHRARPGGRGGDALLPGDVIRYQLRFTNTAGRPVKDVVLTDPVPQGLRFVGASAMADRDDAVVAYSVDGGRRYSAAPVVEVVENGRRVTRPAPPEAYTHVRWTVQGWVQPGAQVTAEFRARLAGGAPPPEPGRPAPESPR